MNIMRLERGSVIQAVVEHGTASLGVYLPAEKNLREP